MVAILSVQCKPSWTEQAGQMLAGAGQFYGQGLGEGGSIPPSSRALWEVRLLLWGAAFGSDWALLDSAAAYAGRRGTRHWGCLVPNAVLCTVGENTTVSHKVITTVLAGTEVEEKALCKLPCQSLVIFTAILPSQPLSELSVWLSTVLASLSIMCSFKCIFYINAYYICHI